MYFCKRSNSHRLYFRPEPSYGCREDVYKRQAGDRLYFTVTADGKPLRQRRYCFSEGFYAIGNAEYYGCLLYTSKGAWLIIQGVR